MDCQRRWCTCTSRCVQGATYCEHAVIPWVRHRALLVKGSYLSHFPTTCLKQESQPSPSWQQCNELQWDLTFSQ
eukprot:776952-Pelagomonas_calceolata.AAC.1